MKNKTVIILLSVLLALTALMMVGCDERQPDGTYINTHKTYRVYVIDSCEYYGVLDCGNGNFLAHKGNCRYCQQRMRKLMLEVRDSLLWSEE